MIKKQVIDLVARQEFTCLGSECERDCCHGWDFIEVDKETTNKWSTIPADGVSDNLESLYLIRKPGETPVMKMSAQGICTALNNDGLCNIQLQFGHDYISQTCRDFPRLNSKNTFREYSTASLSCPPIVENALFKSNDSLFLESESDSDSDSTTQNDALYLSLDTLLNDILDLSDFSLGNTLYFVADLYADIIGKIQLGMISEYDINSIRVDVENYLSDIQKATRQGKIKPNPVTSGSFWKSVHNYCESRKVSSKYLESKDAKLNREISRCDDSISSFGKIYSTIKQYKKKANKQLKQQYNTILRRYIKLLFINKGFPLAPKASLQLSLVECMINICVLQYLLWIGVNKNGKLTDEFVKECIVEVDRKFVQGNVLIKTLEQDSYMTQIEKYCNTFLDIF